MLGTRESFKEDESVRDDRQHYGILLKEMQAFLEG